ncbi:unnamed protein product [Rangifer tarandus platyrhynchus]|uniref:Uncharacterized protein n=2 Tax=Rangifer tarandus platyrhynchus TaxID=3082113 RepID=A0ABN8XRX0_RANTA|nr:unnamed protein product [Rangifer tarandus platyrhynchus]
MRRLRRREVEHVAHFTKEENVASARTSAAQPAVALRGCSPDTAVQTALSRSQSATHCRMALGPQPPDSAVLSGSAWRVSFPPLLFFSLKIAPLLKYNFFLNIYILLKYR